MGILDLTGDIDLILMDALMPDRTVARPRRTTCPRDRFAILPILTVGKQ
jgi:hypothetical protein